MNRILWLLGLLLLVGTAAGAGYVLNHSKASDQAPPPKPAEAEAPPSTVSFGFGDVKPGIANLHPVQAGRVIEVAAEGATVHKGDVLLRLDSRMADIEAERALADWEDAKDVLAQARPLPARHENLMAQQKQAIAIAASKLEGAQQEVEVKEKAYKDRVINIQALRGAQAELKARGAEVAAANLKLKELELVDPGLGVKRAERAVRARELTYRKAKLAQDECVLRAPEDGTVLRVFTQVGETVGTQPRVPAIEFCPQAPRIVRAEVQQEWASRVKVGQEAVIEDDTRAGIRWHGKVLHLSEWYTKRRSRVQEPFEYNDVRTLECLISVEAGENNSPLRIGQRVRVTIKSETP